MHAERTMLCIKACFYQHQDWRRASYSVRAPPELLISDTASSCTQQPGLSSTDCSGVIPVGRAVAFSQADDIWRGALCLRKMDSAEWGMTQHRDPGGYSFRSLPGDTRPRLSSHISSLLCPPSAGAQGKWLQTKFCTLAL